MWKIVRYADKLVGACIYIGRLMGRLIDWLAGRLEYRETATFSSDKMEVFRFVDS